MFRLPPLFFIIARFLRTIKSKSQPVILIRKPQEKKFGGTVRVCPLIRAAERISPLSALRKTWGRTIQFPYTRHSFKYASMFSIGVPRTIPFPAA